MCALRPRALEACHHRESWPHACGSGGRRATRMAKIVSQSAAPSRMDAAPQALLTPRCYTVPVEDGLLHVQLLELGQQVRACRVCQRRAHSVKGGSRMPPRWRLAGNAARVLSALGAAADCACRRCPPPPQTFVWLGHGAPSLSNLTAAVPTRFNSVPAVSNLLGSTDGASLAQRLGARASLTRRAATALTRLLVARNRLAALSLDARYARWCACACNSYEDRSRRCRLLQHPRQLAAAAGAPPPLPLSPGVRLTNLLAAPPMLPRLGCRREVPRAAVATSRGISAGSEAGRQARCCRPLAT